jgi:hypothetical protein
MTDKTLEEIKTKYESALKKYYDKNRYFETKCILCPDKKGKIMF